MLYEIACADAYGAAFEFTDTPNIANDLSRYGSHPTGELVTGAYTDDTMRSLANAELVLRGGTDLFRPEAYAKAYVDAYRADGRKGWSKRFDAMLGAHLNSDGIALVAHIERRATNGCIMGAAPLGYLRTPAEVRLAATMQTVSTHAASAVPYVQAIALCAHFLLDGHPRGHAMMRAVDEAEWADSGDRDRFILAVREGPVPKMPVVSIAAGALHGLTTLSGLADMLRWSCSRGGDTDSLAAVTVGLGSVARDVSQDLPMNLLETVDVRDNRRMLREMDARLRAMVERRA